MATFLILISSSFSKNLFQFFGTKIVSTYVISTSNIKHQRMKKFDGWDYGSDAYTTVLIDASDFFIV